MKYSIPQSPGVYIIRCLKNNKIYIGSSVNLRSRLLDHKRTLRKGNHHNHHLQNAWNKYSETQFEFKILEYCHRDLTLEREQYWLDVLRPYEHEKGFNIGTKADAAQFGKTPSDQTREKLSQKAKEFWSTPEGKEKKVIASTGRIFSNETKEKIRLSNTGQKRSIETRTKISEAKKHQQCSAETRVKMSIAQQGKKMSPEAIAKTVAANEKWWIVTTPNGEESLIKNLGKFCKEHNLNRGNMIMVAQGKRPHNKGWKCRYA